MGSDNQAGTNSLADLFGPGAVEFLKERSSWKERYSEMFQRISEARKTGEISDELLKDLWWTRKNGVTSIRVGAMGEAAFEAAKEKLRVVTGQILVDCSEDSYRMAIATFEELKAEGLVNGVLYAVIHRVFAAAYPDKCTTAAPPKLFRELASQINEKFGLNISGEKPDWLRSNIALKQAVNRVKPESFDDIDTNIAIWRVQKGGEMKELEDLGIDEPQWPTNSNTVKEREPLLLNQILYGPPGTGKTYRTTDLAVKIADPEWYKKQSEGKGGAPSRSGLKDRYDELVAEKRIVFTTFHQSFAYEDFIEGIRAETNEQGVLSYPIQEGVFKQLCESADAKVTLQSGEAIELAGRNVWKMSLGNTLAGEDDIYQECLENGYVLLGYGEVIDFTRCENRDSVRKQFESVESLEIQESGYPITAVHNFRNVVKKGDVVVVSDGNHKFRAIGEIIGDYQFLRDEDRFGYRQMRKVKWHRQYEPSLPREQLLKKAFSQMTIYELRPTSIDMDKLSQLLAPEGVREQDRRPHVLIIDEINRGNISRIFGELITLLEPAKRKGAEDAREVVLPYSKERFSVPSNVYVIGTMNTADKSLAQLDLALRRRFTFIEIPPEPSRLTGVRVYGIDIGEMLSVINQRIEVLLDRDHLIGHSYFMPLLQTTSVEEREAGLSCIFEKQVIPLLQEYFFDDWQRIRWVLNDEAKLKDDQFISAGGAQNLDTLFTADVAGQISDRRFYVNSKAFSRAAAYIGILGGSGSTGGEAVPEEAEAEAVEP